MCMTTTSAPADPTDKYVPAGTAAKLLHCHIDTIRRYEAQGKIKAWRTPGNQRRFKLADIEALKADAA